MWSVFQGVHPEGKSQGTYGHPYQYSDLMITSYHGNCETTRFNLISTHAPISALGGLYGLFTLIIFGFPSNQNCVISILISDMELSFGWKKCRAWSAGFIRSQLILIFTLFKRGYRMLKVMCTVGLLCQKQYSKLYQKFEEKKLNTDETCIRLLKGSNVIFYALTSAGPWGSCLNHSQKGEDFNNPQCV